MTFHGGAAWSEIQYRFASFVRSGTTYNVNRGIPGKENPLGCNPACSHYEYETNTAWIFDEDFDRIENGVFKRGHVYNACGINFTFPRYTAAQIVLHELFGHGWFGRTRASHSGPMVWKYENMYLRIRGRPTECP